VASPPVALPALRVHPPARPTTQSRGAACPHQLCVVPQSRAFAPPPRPPIPRLSASARPLQSPRPILRTAPPPSNHGAAATAVVYAAADTLQRRRNITRPREDRSCCPESGNLCPPVPLVSRPHESPCPPACLLIGLTPPPRPGHRRHHLHGRDTGATTSCPSPHTAGPSSPKP
jgi:hypothetical protein